MTVPTDEELLAYADELLDIAAAVQIEQQLRDDQPLRTRLRELLEQRDQGNLSIGDLWRHHRLSCPEQTQLGLYLVRALPADQYDYIQFHLNEIGCVYCQAQLEEMQTSTQVDAADLAQQQRRESLYASSAGLLKSQRPDP